MGQITTGTGLVSGLDIQGIVDQLIAIEARPRDQVQRRNAELEAQQVAYQTVNAQLLGFGLSVDTLTQPTTFNSTVASSSNESILTASSGTSAAPGTYSFQVQQLVSSQQSITRGFSDIDTTAIGAGSLTFESAQARLDSETELSRLNGGQGVNRGYIRISDRSGSSSIVDLTTVVTVNDVIDRINNTNGINVIASIDGDSIKIEDTSGSSASNLRVQNVGATSTASSLGILANSGSDTIFGNTINTVGLDSALADLNDGNGVRRRAGSTDFIITDKDGTNYNINIDNTQTLGDVVNVINAETGGSVVASIASDGQSLALTDLTAGGGTLTVAASGASQAAADLGILGSDSDGDNVIDGKRLVAEINSKLLRFLNGGDGVTSNGAVPSNLSRDTLISDLLGGAGITTTGDALPELRLQPSNRTTNGTIYTVDLDAISTVGDLIDEIESVTGGGFTVDIASNGLTVSDDGSGPFDVLIGNTNGTGSAVELDIRTFLSPPGTVTVGSDLNPLVVAEPDSSGTIEITDQSGVVQQISLNGIESVSEFLEAFNGPNNAAGVVASLNEAGNGILLTDTSGGSGSLKVADIGGGSFAAQFNLQGTFNDGLADSGNLEYQYITESTTLDSLEVSRGRFRITDSDGLSRVVDLTQGNEETLADVISEINSRGLAVNARINDTGDGLLIEDTGSGVSAIIIEEDGNTTAADLGILGTASGPGVAIDGSFETTISFSSETLSLTDNLSVINSGSGVSPVTGQDDLQITDRDGNTYDINVDGLTTVQDLVTAVNTATAGNVTLGLNPGGTGLRLTDNTGGAGTLAVTALNNSDVATELGLAGEASNDTTIESGSLVSITTLESLAQQINNESTGIRAQIINDGSSGNPFRLSLTSDRTGRLGAFTIDDGNLNLNTTTLSEASDAVVFYGGSDPTNSLLITSTSNTLSNVIPGVEINLINASSERVNLSIQQDTGRITEAIQRFVDDFNSLNNTIFEFDSFNTETQQRGILLGDPGLATVQQQLFGGINQRLNDFSGQFTALSDVGITVRSGAQLTFDADRFAQALETDKDAVIDLFTLRETEEDADGEEIVIRQGIGQILQDIKDRLTDPDSGAIESRIDANQAQIDLNNLRIESLTESLERSRERLTAEFIAMENTLAQLQNQSNALASLQPVQSSGGSQ